MAVITYENVTPTLIPNTEMNKMLLDGVHKVYTIEAVDGYVLHDNRADTPLYDSETHETIVGVELRYASGSKTVRYDYDFDTVVPDTITDVNGNTIAVNKIGQYELFAVPASAVPSDSIYGGVNNDHEVM